MKNLSRVVSFFCLMFFVLTAPQIVKAFSITEQWDYFYGFKEKAEFIIDNSSPSYPNIVEFVVGNDKAKYASVNNELPWKGKVVINKNPGDSPDWTLEWLNSIEKFNTYEKAFYFFAEEHPVWVPDREKGGHYEGYKEPLPEGITDGFYGWTLVLSSPFAIRDNNGTVVLKGDTSTVPIPTTMLLFASGLGALGFSINRRKNR